MDLIKWVIPRVSWKDTKGILLVSLIGALCAGFYGIIHDQVTYSISAEYFTRNKFQQFAYAEPRNGSERLFAGTIGFLATWWVGALLAWVMARVAILKGWGMPSLREFSGAFAITFSVSFLVALGGLGYGFWRKTTGYAGSWIEWMDALGVVDREAFMTVGYIHNSSYLGGVLGTFVAIGYLRSENRKAMGERELAESQGKG